MVVVYKVCSRGYIISFYSTPGDVDDDSEKPSPSIASYYTTVNEGESTSLLCAFQGVPYPTYRWEIMGDRYHNRDINIINRFDKHRIKLISGTRLSVKHV